MAWPIDNHTQSKGPFDDNLLTVAGDPTSRCNRNQNLSGRTRLRTGQQSHSLHVSRTRRSSYTDLPVFAFELGLSRFRPKDSSYSSTLRCLASSRARLPAGLRVGGEKKRTPVREGGCCRRDKKSFLVGDVTCRRCYLSAMSLVGDATCRRCYIVAVGVDWSSSRDETQYLASEYVTPSVKVIAGYGEERRKRRWDKSYFITSTGAV